MSLHVRNGQKNKGKALAALQLRPSDTLLDLAKRLCAEVLPKVSLASSPLFQTGLFILQNPFSRVTYDMPDMLSLRCSKLLMSSILLFVWEGSPSQVCAAFFITLVSLFVVTFFSPYADPYVGRVQVTALSCEALTLLSGLFLNHGSV